MPSHEGRLCIFAWLMHNMDSQLFGEDEDAVGELDEAEKQGENGNIFFSLGSSRFCRSLTSNIARDSAQEIENLRKEALAFRAVRAALRSKQANDGDAARKVFHKVGITFCSFPHLPNSTDLTQVFTADILNLLTMSDMWRARAPPTPLN